MNNKNVEDKPGQETPNLVDAREKPQDGEKPFDQFFLLLYQRFDKERESTNSKS